MEKSGNWLFKYRSFFPLILYIIVVPVLYFNKPDFFGFQEVWWSAICFAVSMFGVAIRAHAIGFSAVGTSGRNTGQQIADSVNTTGLYSVVRHPLYLGNFLMWLGLALYVGDPLFLLFMIAFFWFYYERIMFAEEMFVSGKFYKEYSEWAALTPAFIPRLSGYKKSKVKFSLIRVLRREYHGIFAIILTFVIINFLKHLFTTGKINLDIEWIIGGAAGLLFYLVVRFLVKMTKVLLPR